MNRINGLPAGSSCRRPDPGIEGMDCRAFSIANIIMQRLHETMKALEVEKIDVRFGGLRVLTMCSLSVEVGERRAIIGPNGAGKTTLFNVLSGVVAPTAGGLKLFGKEITNLSPHARAHLGLARTFQVTNLFPNLTVTENIILGLQALTGTKYVFYRTMRSLRNLLKRAEDLLERWGLGEKRNEIVRNLSHGEQRQLEIILALATDPKILLLDEPTQGLSSSETALVIPMVESLDKSTTVLFIEHDMDVAFQMAETITVLHFGCVLAEGDERTIRSNTEVSDVYLGIGGSHA